MQPVCPNKSRFSCGTTDLFSDKLFHSDPVNVSVTSLLVIFWRISTYTTVEKQSWAHAKTAATI